MKEIDAKKVKSIGYIMGQALAVVCTACIIALMLGGTCYVLKSLF